MTVPKSHQLMNFCKPVQPALPGARRRFIVQTAARVTACERGGSSTGGAEYLGRGKPQKTMGQKTLETTDSRDLLKMNPATQFFLRFLLGI